MLNLLRNLKHGGARYVAGSITKLGEWLTVGHLQGRIASGPFLSVKFPEKEIFGGRTAKLLGTYELELHPALEVIGRLQPSVVLNVGGAEGYYAVGVAASWGAEKVIVYESTAEGRERIVSNARLNNCDAKLTICGVCTAQSLIKTLNTEAVELLIMDIEGSELDVLEPDVLHGLEHCIVVIESHDFCRAGCIDELRSRFHPTHAVEIVTSRKRRAPDFPYPSRMPNSLKKSLMDEQRPGPMQWLVGYPRSSPWSNSHTSIV